MTPHRKAGWIGPVLAGLLLATTACAPEEPWAGQSQVTLAALGFLDPDSVCTAQHASPRAASFFLLLATGLLTGFSHCIGMCGPLVGAFAMRRRAGKQEVSTPLVLFQLGRLTTYVILGAILGATGYFLASVIRDWQGIISVMLGGLMVLLGLSLLGLLPVQRWLAAAAPAHTISRWMRHLIASPHPAAPFGLGLANGLLPCGPIYAMGLLAATSGDPFKGAGLMLIFGLGTLPAMLGVGLSVSQLSLRLRSGLYRVAALLVVLVGVQLALRGLAVSGQVSHVTVGSVMLW